MSLTLQSSETDKYKLPKRKNELQNTEQIRINAGHYVTTSTAPESRKERPRTPEIVTSTKIFTSQRR